MQVKRLITPPSDAVSAAFNPLDLEEPYDVEKAVINHGLDVGPIIRADQLNVAEVTLPITLEGKNNLIRIADILDDMMRLWKATAYRETLSASIMFELERRKVISSLLAELHDEILVCKKIGLTVSYSCTQDIIEKHSEYGSKIEPGWVASLTVEYTYKN